MNPFSWFKRFGKPTVRPDRTPPIIVVSGLPRSGTSLMMQMLEAGGVQIATDGLRTADADNPRGYYELEGVKRLDHDASCLSACEGKAVKIISMLLSALPARYDFRIIFMERRLPEVLASQMKMLERKGTPDSGQNDEGLATIYERHLVSVKKSLASRPNVRTLYISHHEALQSPLQAARQVREFLEQDLDLEAMVAVVDKKLHRHKEPAAQAQLCQGSPGAKLPS